MPPKPTAARKAAKKTPKSFEETLWETATKLRGSVESADWSGVTESERRVDRYSYTSLLDNMEGLDVGTNRKVVTGSVLAISTMASNITSAGSIRQKMVENILVDCMVAGPIRDQLNFLQIAA